MYMPFDPAIPLVGISPQIRGMCEMTHVQGDSQQPWFFFFHFITLFLIFIRV